MSFETIELKLQGPVAILSLNRPDKLNAINRTMLQEIEAALDQIEENDNVYSLVLNGNGKSFCSGFDLQAGVAANRKGEDAWRAALQYDLDVIASMRYDGLRRKQSVWRTRSEIWQQHRRTVNALVHHSQAGQKNATFW
jgi:enoyl-CoA hydratase/carnithine racemase